MKKYIPYAQREEWNDVEPIFQDDGPDPIVPIAYSAECTFLEPKMSLYRVCTKHLV